MQILKGKYNQALIMIDYIDEATTSQLYSLLNHPAFANSHIAIMADTQSGEGSVVGFTMRMNGYVIPNIVGVDIGCLDKDTEFLSDHGWKKISEYRLGDRVLQYSSETDNANFVYPLRYIVKSCSEFVHFKNKGLDQVLSVEHKMLVWMGYKGRGYTLKNFSPAEICGLGSKLDNGYYGVKASFNLDSNGIDITDAEIRLDVMIAADGSIKWDRGNEHQIYLHLRKERKVERAKAILQENGVEFSCSVGKDKSTNIYFFVDKRFNKDLSKYWHASKSQLMVLAEESLLWDGHSGYRSFFSSTNKVNADIVQFAFAANDVRAGISTIEYIDKPWSSSYIVTPAKNNIIGITNDVSTVEAADGRKYCFTVPSGYFVARRNGKIFITGNCGVNAYNLGKIKFDMPAIVALDNFVHANIPHGFNVNQNTEEYNKLDASFLTRLRRVCEITGQDHSKVARSVCSLGGGNHFLEVDLDPKGNYWLLVHTGSRNFGLQVCKFYQKKAEELIRKMFLGASAYKGLEYLPMEMGGNDYLYDMYVAQDYALYNRRAIGQKIMGFLGVAAESHIESVHNYINDIDGIIRKGAISANLGQKVVIPFNSKQGVAIATGKGSRKWNYSAPHGAGRIMSRTVAKATLDVDQYQKDMAEAEIYTTTANASTIDECWRAYKNKEDIVAAVAETVDIDFFMRPVWNFKSGTKTEV